MRDAAPLTVRLADYGPPAFLVETVHLTFVLARRATRVSSRIHFTATRRRRGRSICMATG